MEKDLEVWHEPLVTVVAYTMRDIHTRPVGGMWQTNDPRPVTSCEALPEIGGRVCYMSYGKGRKNNSDYIANILAKGHESVLEHAVVSFGIEGISRSCSHEMVRHRHLSFSQTSQRYVRTVAFVVPPHLPEAVFAQWYDMCCLAHDNYWKLIKSVEEQDAKGANAVGRSILPNCTETKMLVTGNMRAWRHFVKIRGTEHAEVEIRRLACAILDELKKLAPNVFQDLEVVDGTVRTIPPK